MTFWKGQQYVDSKKKKKNWWLPEVREVRKKRVGQGKHRDFYGSEIIRYDTVMVATWHYLKKEEKEKEKLCFLYSQHFRQQMWGGFLTPTPSPTSRYQMGVLQFNSDSNYPELAQTPHKVSVT